MRQVQCHGGPSCSNETEDLIAIGDEPVLLSFRRQFIVHRLRFG